MKILLATDGSEYNNLAVKEFPARLFAPKTEVFIVSAFVNCATIMTTAAPMGVLADNYEEADCEAKKSAENAVKSAADLLQKTNRSVEIVRNRRIV